MNKNKHFLFSYGTLQLKNVQLKNYGRLLNGKTDSLKKFKIEKLKITNPEVIKTSGKEFHPIAIKTNNPKDLIEGSIFEITEAELYKTDLYEVNDYERTLEMFSSGQKAWIYVAKKNNKDSKNKI